MTEAPLSCPRSPGVITAARGAGASFWYAVGGGALIAGGGHCVPAAEPGAGGVYLVEPAGPQHPADLGGEVCLPPLRLSPDPQAGSPPHPLGPPHQPPPPPRGPRRELPLGARGHAQ